MLSILGAQISMFTSLPRLIVMAVATVTDSVYAVLAGSARHVMTRARMRLLGRISGTILMLGDVWLALARRE